MRNFGRNYEDSVSFVSSDRRAVGEIVVKQHGVKHSDVLDSNEALSCSMEKAMHADIKKRDRKVVPASLSWLSFYL